MNKKEFIDKLNKETGYDIDKCSIINEVMESHFIIGKNNKEKIINDFNNRLDINREEASELYNKCVDILGSQLKNKIKHPFKSKK